jgi:hypothetical protein
MTGTARLNITPENAKKLLADLQRFVDVMEQGEFGPDSYFYTTPVEVSNQFGGPGTIKFRIAKEA